MTQIIVRCVDTTFVFNPENIIPIIEEGIQAEMHIRDVHKILGNNIEYFKSDLRITRAETFLSLLRLHA